MEKIKSNKSMHQMARTSAALTRTGLLAPLVMQDVRQKTP